MNLSYLFLAIIISALCHKILFKWIKFGFFDNQDLHLTNSQYTNLTLNSSLEGKERVYIENIQPLLDALNTDLNIHYFLIYFIMMTIYLFTIKIILDKNIQFDFIKKNTLWEN